MSCQAPGKVNQRASDPASRATFPRIRMGGWKGTASYYDLVVDGEVNKDAVWYYPQPKELAKGIENRVAFWKGVKVINE